MTTAADVIEIAVRELGYRENPAGSNHNKYGRWYGTDGVPWCGCFVSYCFYSAGLPLPGQTNKGFNYCPAEADWFKRKGHFYHTPKVGDVVFFDWHPGTRDSDAWHVGIVEQINPDGSITSIEGNTGNGSREDNGGQVLRKKHYSHDWYGFGRPDYSGPNQPLESDHPNWPERFIYLTSPHVTGEDVQIWKKQMIARGWDLGTGKLDEFDQRADEVLRKFQAEKALEVDGILGPCSWNAAWETPVT